MTSYTYDDTGQRLTMTDPCGNTSCSDMTGSNHTTSYSYADYDAYVSEISYPTTANGAGWRRVSVVETLRLLPSRDSTFRPLDAPRVY